MPEPEPRSAQEWLADGDAARAAGDGAEALWRYLRAHEQDPDDPRPMLRIGSLHLTREPAHAESIFRDLTKTSASAALAHLGLGLALLAQNEFGPAEQSLARAEAEAPELAAAPAARGVALDRLGHPEEAQESYWRALSRHPDDPMVLNNLGVSYLSTRAYGRAAEVLTRAAELAPRDPAVQNNLGLALVGIGREREALEAFLRAGEPQAAHNNLATAYLLTGQLERAVAEYERALLQPGDARLAVLRNLRSARQAMRAGAPAQPTEAIPSTLRLRTPPDDTSGSPAALPEASSAPGDTAPEDRSPRAAQTPSAPVGPPEAEPHSSSGDPASSPSSTTTTSSATSGTPRSSGPASASTGVSGTMTR